MNSRGRYLLVVAEGWQKDSVGLTLPELAEEMLKLGAVNAINLDGGASTSLVAKDRLIHPPAAEPFVANAPLLTW